MSKIKEVLRLKYLNQLSNRQIQSITGVSRNSVANYMKIYLELDSSIDEILALSDIDLEDLFHPKKFQKLKSKNLHMNQTGVKYSKSLQEKG